MDKCIDSNLDSDSDSDSGHFDPVLNGARILIVEDNAFNQQVAIELLEQAGVISTIANNGREAIELLRQQNFDCILMDMQMPEMDGIEATRHIRSDIDINDLPIIAMTANASITERKLCFDAGMDDFISKPIDPKILYATLAKWLEHRMYLTNFMNDFVKSQNDEERNIVINKAESVSMLPSDPTIINLNILADLVNYNRNKVNIFAMKFLDTAKEVLTEIDLALARKDILALHALGHRIKSSARTVGAMEFAVLCQTLEGIDNDNLLVANDIVNQLHILLEKIDGVINDFFETEVIIAPLVSSIKENALRVLVVDDEEFQIEFVKSKLHALNIFDIIPAQNGDQAMTQFDTLDPKPDIIICDLNMPWMDGVEFLRNIAGKNFKGGIILLSGVDASMLKAAELLAGVHGLNVLAAIQKPLKTDVLMAAIEKFHHHVSTSHVKRAPKTVMLPVEELRFCISNDMVELFYQPKVSIVDKHVVGFECLARLRHPEKGLIQPNSFIAVAEKNNLINELTLVVLRKAALQLCEWLAQGHHLIASVNVSMDNLTQLDLPEVFDHIVRSAGVEPKNIILELTESRLMQNFTVSLDIITRLRLKGFGLSIDDFGTGFSSMENLNNLPFTELKVDRAFVNGATKDAAACAILESSINLGKSFNLVIIAEGVETQDDWDLVALKGCDEVQGYFVARPMPAAEFEKWKEEWDKAR